MADEKPDGGRDWEFIRRELPDFSSAFFKVASHSREGSGLDPKTCELIFFASTASPSHFYDRGFLFHARGSMAEGATMAELLGVLAVLSTMGMQSLQLGASIVADESETGLADSEQVAKVRARHTALLGVPVREAELAIRADPDFYDAWLDLAETCFGPACVLTPKVAHLVAVATSAQCSQLNAAGVRQHARAAIAAGVSTAELLDACKLVFGIGGHAMAMGVPLLMDC